MQTTASPYDAFVEILKENNLVSSEVLEQLSNYQRSSPGCGQEELADFLVEEGHLTRFQADTILAGSGSRLTLAQFTLLDEIGTGTMGAVYQARSSKDDSRYAIKIIPRRNVANLQDIGEKVAALKQVRHPRVSAMVHVGAQGDRVYMVWPLLEGGEKLDAIVERQGKLPPRQAAQVALQVASGLQAYHEQGLFHGLLKPSDILIGNDRRVRILDFGVGFLLTCERGKSLLDTQTNGKAMARGLDCASPESILNPLDRSPWGDQYSLGCILYFCLAGHFPFPNENPVKKMLGHQNEEPKPIRELTPEVPAKLAAIVHRLLRKTPQERYPSMEEAVAELQAVISDVRWTTPQVPAAARAPSQPVPEMEMSEPGPGPKSRGPALTKKLAVADRKSVV